MSQEILEVVWSNSAKKQLRKIYNHIAEDSPKNAVKVITDIIDFTDTLASQSNRCALDLLKKNNQGNYRFFIKHNFRTVYKVEKKQVRVIRIRHVKQEPLHY